MIVSERSEAIYLRVYSSREANINSSILTGEGNLQPLTSILFRVYSNRRLLPEVYINSVFRDLAGGQSRDTFSRAGLYEPFLMGIKARQGRTCRDRWQ